MEGSRHNSSQKCLAHGRGRLCRLPNRAPSARPIRGRDGSCVEQRGRNRVNADLDAPGNPKDMKSDKKELSPKQREELLSVLRTRFEKNMNRHQGFEWAKVKARLETRS